MNIKDAKQIPLQVVVERLGGRYSHTDRRGDFWYFSPFRPEEKTASFKVSVKYNNWHDFGHAGLISRNGKSIQGSGGDILDLWCDYHAIERRTGIKEALQGLSQLRNFDKYEPSQFLPEPKGKRTSEYKEGRYKILKIADYIRFAGLKAELTKRRITLEMANLYLKQAQILDTVTNKSYYGFLFENDKGSYEVSIPNPIQGNCFKTCIGNKSIRTIKPIKETTAADIFEGFWDFISWLQIKKIKTPAHYTFILNSTSLAGEAVKEIVKLKGNLKTAYLFMDNDDSGFQTMHYLVGEMELHSIEANTMEYFYKGFKDVNEYSISR